MRSTLGVLALVFVTASAGAVHADELRIPIGSQGHVDASGLPARGISMERVRAGWGEPEVTLDPVGQPPITRWDYPDFSVYFEYRHVVHAVVRHRRADAPATPPMEP